MSSHQPDQHNLSHEKSTKEKVIEKLEIAKEVIKEKAESLIEKITGKSSSDNDHGKDLHDDHHFESEHTNKVVHENDGVVHDQNFQKPDMVKHTAEHDHVLGADHRPDDAQRTMDSLAREIHEKVPRVDDQNSQKSDLLKHGGAHDHLHANDPRPEDAQRTMNSLAREIHEKVPRVDDQNYQKPDMLKHGREHDRVHGGEFDRHDHLDKDPRPEDTQRTMDSLAREIHEKVPKVQPIGKTSYHSGNNSHGHYRTEKDHLGNDMSGPISLNDHFNKDLNKEHGTDHLRQDIGGKSKVVVLDSIHGKGPLPQYDINKEHGTDHLHNDMQGKSKVVDLRNENFGNEQAKRMHERILADER
jgi:hypothetical protein